MSRDCSRLCCRDAMPRRLSCGCHFSSISSQRGLHFWWISSDPAAGGGRLVIARFPSFWPQLIVEQQDEQLELVSGSIGVLKNMSQRIGGELEEQAV